MRAKFIGGLVEPLRMLFKDEVRRVASVMIFMAVLDFAAVSACCAAPDFKGRIFFAAGKQPQLTVKLAKGEDALKIAQKLVGNYAVARSSSTESGNP